MFRLCLLIVFFTGLISCVQKKNRQEPWPYDERLYIQIDSVVNDSGDVTSRIYRSKVDPQRLQTKNINEQGIVYLSGFYLGKIKEGPFKMFYPDGSIMSITWLKNNKNSGLNLMYNSDTVTRITYYRNGTFIPLDWAEEKRLIDSVNSVENYKDSNIVR